MAVLLKRMTLWGVIGGIVGAVISDMSSYDPSESAALYGCGVGFVLGAAMAMLFSGRQPDERSE
jgi:hypothetical protein